jgi:dolichol kinase
MKKLIVRKLYRLVLLVVPVLYYYWYKKYYVLAIVCAFAFSLTLDIIRLTNPAANEKVRQFFGPFAKFMRFIAKREELRDLSGTTYTLMGCTIVMVFMPKTVGITAILFNIFGDLFATIIGIRFGKTKILGEKTLEGSLACFISLIIVVAWSNWKLQLPWVVGIIGAVIATITELVPIKIHNFKINDNLTIPILSGVVMWLLL